MNIIDKDKLEGAIKEISREIGFRNYLYPKWIVLGKIKKEQAEAQLQHLKDAYDILNFLNK